MDTLRQVKHPFMGDENMYLLGEEKGHNTSFCRSNFKWIMIVIVCVVLGSLTIFMVNYYTFLSGIVSECCGGPPSLTEEAKVFFTLRDAPRLNHSHYGPNSFLNTYIIQSWVRDTSWWNQAREKAGIQMHFGGHSMPLGNGYLWLFSRTILTDNHSRFSSAMYVQGVDWFSENANISAQYLTGPDGIAACDVMPHPPLVCNGAYIQKILTGFRVPSTNLTYMFYSLEDKHSSAFDSVHLAVASSNFFFSRMEPLSVFHYPKAVAYAFWPRDDYIYLYSVKHFQYSCKVFLSKVLPRDLPDASRYLHWNGSSFTDSPLTAQHLNINCGEQPVSVAWNSYLSKYLMIFAGFGLKKVWMTSSPTPWGPWKDPTIIFEDTEPGSPIELVSFLPEWFLDGGKTMFLTYTQESKPNPVLLEVHVTPSTED